MSNTQDIPVWEKYTLTIEEASKYFRIGENKLRRLAEENKDAGWLIMNGNRIQIKRRQFEKVIDKLDAIWCCIIKVDTLFSRILIYNHNQYENRRKTYGTESKIL